MAAADALSRDVRAPRCPAGSLHSYSNPGCEEAEVLIVLSSALPDTVYPITQLLGLPQQAQICEQAVLLSPRCRRGPVWCRERWCLCPARPGGSVSTLQPLPPHRCSQLWSAQLQRVPGGHQPAEKPNVPFGPPVQGRLQRQHASPRLPRRQPGRQAPSAAPQPPGWRCRRRSPRAVVGFALAGRRRLWPRVQRFHGFIERGTPFWEQLPRRPPPPDPRCAAAAAAAPATAPPQGAVPWLQPSCL